MKKLFKTVSIVLLCGILSCPVIEAQGRDHNNSGQRPAQSQSASGKSNSKRSNNNNGARPGANSGQSNRNNNGGNQGNRNNNGARPGANSGQTNRNNGGNMNQGNRPGNNGGGMNQGNRPGNNGGMQNRPNGGNFGHAQSALPSRQHMPAMRPYRRPTPPPTWRPVGRIPVLSTILGMTFGTALNLSVNYLINQGYNVLGYGDGMIYLSNVMQFNYLWPDATLYYGTNGGLDASSFVYSTLYNDMGRYNSVYNGLYRLYGTPVSYENTGNTITSSWFGNNGQFVTLSFGPSYTSAGQLRYFTTLSFGN